MSNKSIIIKDATKNILANLIGLPVSLLSLLIVARYLGPEKTGITASAVTLVLTYSVMSHLGTLNALSIRYPYLIGKNTKESLSEAEKMPDVILRFILVSALICTIIISPFSIYYFLLNNNVWGFAFLTALVLSILILFKTFSIFVLRGKNNFDAISNNTLLFFWTPITYVFAVKYFDLYGLWIAMIFAEVLITFDIFSKTKLKLKLNFKINWVKTFKYIKIGMPVFFVAYFYEIFNTSDKLVTVYILGSTELGNYSIATLSARIISFFPVIVSTIMWPRIASKIGENVKKSQILILVRAPTLLLSFSLPIVIGLLYFLTPVIITLILPKYVSGINAAQSVIFTIYFIGIMGMYTAYLSTSYKLKEFSVLILIGLISYFLMIYFINTYLDITILNISIARVLAFLFMSAITVLYVEYILSNSLIIPIKSLVKLLLPIIYLLIVIKFLMPLILFFSPADLGVHSSESELIKIIANQGILATQFQNYYFLIIKVVTFSVFMIPLLFLAYKKLGFTNFKQLS